jgi:CRISPR-associated protein Csb2
LEIAEQVRRRLMGIHRNLMGGDPRKVSSKFSGKDAGGKPLRGHRHAFILPQDADRDGWLDHLLVICRDNLDLDECRALDLLDRLYQRGGKPDVRCIPIRWGALDDLLKPAGRFISATPFVPPRHYRRGRGDFAEWLLAQIRLEATNRSLPKISRIALVPRLCNQGKVVAWFDFRRNRKDDTVKPGYGFEIEFAQPVMPECGPMALGYGAHFGLGQFRTV